MKRLYPLVRAKLAELDIQYAEIARTIGRSEPYISDIMRGAADPRLGDCYKILDIIGVDHAKLGEYFNDAINTNGRLRIK